METIVTPDDLFTQHDALFDSLERRYGRTYAVEVETTARLLSYDGQVLALGALTSGERQLPAHDARLLFERHTAMMRQANEQDRTARTNTAAVKPLAAALLATELIMQTVENTLDAAATAHELVRRVDPHHAVPDRAELAQHVVDFLTRHYHLRTD